MKKGEHQTHLPTTSLKQLRQRKLATIQLGPQRDINVGAELIQEAHGDAAPLDDDVVAGLEHGRDLDAAGADAPAVVGVVPQPALLVGPLEGQHAEVDEEAAVAVLGEAREQLGAGELDAQQRRHGLHQRVREPLRELVEGQDRLPRLRGRARARARVVRRRLRRREGGKGRRRRGQGRGRRGRRRRWGRGLRHRAAGPGVA